MRVLQVASGLAARTGGPAANVVESSLALEQAGVRVTVFSTDLAGPATAPGRGPATFADLPEGAAALDLELFPARAPRRLACSPALARALRRRVRAFDVVHVHSLYLHPNLAAFRAAGWSGVPYVVSPCGSLDPALRHRSMAAKAAVDALWQRRALDRAAALHFKTEGERALVADLGLAAPAAVVPNGIHCARFAQLPDPRAFRARRIGGFDGPVVLSLGRLSHKKGLDVLVAAFARLAARDARLVVAGPDDEGLSPRLQALARAAGVADRVVFTGMLDGDERLEALAAADVFALPSRTENFGSAVLEALAAGVPTVVSPAVNLADDAGAAVVVADAAPEPLALALDRVLADAALRARLRESGRSFAAGYDWPVVARRLVALYEQAAARGRVRRLETRAAVA